jgi:hypothetical protein
VHSYLRKNVHCYLPITHIEDYQKFHGKDPESTGIEELI